jgi:hypothetical protein
VVPDLVEDNPVHQTPYGAGEEVTTSQDLADKAITMIRDQQAANPSRPWFRGSTLGPTTPRITPQGLHR